LEDRGLDHALASPRATLTFDDVTDPRVAIDCGSLTDLGALAEPIRIEDG
jgi:hypothetical protein